jgi:hypothetical protein
MCRPKVSIHIHTYTQAGPVEQYHAVLVLDASGSMSGQRWQDLTRCSHVLICTVFSCLKHNDNYNNTSGVKNTIFSLP